jgi:hypothetical protein
VFCLAYPITLVNPIWYNICLCIASWYAGINGDNNDSDSRTCIDLHFFQDGKHLIIKYDSWIWSVQLNRTRYGVIIHGSHLPHHAWFSFIKISLGRALRASFLRIHSLCLHLSAVWTLLFTSIYQATFTFVYLR